MRILVASGGSYHSNIAVDFAAQILLASRTPHPPTVMTVLKHSGDHSQGLAIVDQARQTLANYGLTAHTCIRVGHPAEEIICQAEEDDYNLVIVGERQHHRLVTRFLLGSTAERVVEHAPCPVIIAKGHIMPIQHLLLCDSGADSPSLLVRFTTQFASLLKGNIEVAVLHVMSQISAGPGVPGKQLRAMANELINDQSPEGQLLEQDVHTLKQLNMTAYPIVRHGLVVDEILAEAQNGHYSLVAIGAHRGQGWRNILLDDLAHQVIARVDRPILIIR